jgi:hypothetical protein
MPGADVPEQHEPEHEPAQSEMATSSAAMPRPGVWGGREGLVAQAPRSERAARGR